MGKNCKDPNSCPVGRYVGVSLIKKNNSTPIASNDGDAVLNKHFPELVALLSSPTFKYQPGSNQIGTKYLLRVDVSNIPEIANPYDLGNYFKEKSSFVAMSKRQIHDKKRKNGIRVERQGN